MTSLTTSSHSPLQPMHIMYYISGLFCILILSKGRKINHKKKRTQYKLYTLAPCNKTMQYCHTAISINFTAVQ